MQFHTFLVGTKFKYSDVNVYQTDGYDGPINFCFVFNNQHYAYLCNIF